MKIHAHEEGLWFNVRAQPGARKAEIRGVHDGRLKVAITEPPEKGKANEAIIDLLASALSVRKSQLAIVSGQASRSKRVSVCGVEERVLRERLVELLS